MENSLGISFFSFSPVFKKNSAALPTTKRRHTRHDQSAFFFFFFFFQKVKQNLSSSLVAGERAANEYIHTERARQNGETKRAHGVSDEEERETKKKKKKSPKRTKKSEKKAERAPKKCAERRECFFLTHSEIKERRG